MSLSKNLLLNVEYGVFNNHKGNSISITLLLIIYIVWTFQVIKSVYIFKIIVWISLQKCSIDKGYILPTIKQIIDKR